MPKRIGAKSNPKLLSLLIILLFPGVSSIAQEAPQLVLPIGHTDDVNCAAFSPDGGYVLSGSKDRTLKLWEMATGREVRTYEGHTDEINEVAFSPDGRFVLSGGRGGDVKLWEMATGREVKTIQLWEGGTFPGSRLKSIAALGFSSDGGRFFISYDDIVRLWNTSSNQVLDFRCSSGITHAVLSADDRFILASCKEGFLNLWEVSTGVRLFSVKGHDSYITEVAFSPNGDYFLSASADSTMKLWEVSTGSEVRTFRGHTEGVTSAMFSPDGRQVLSSSWDETMKLWEVATAQEIQTYRDQRFSLKRALAIAPEGRFALSTNWHNIILWDLETGRQVVEFGKVKKDAIGSLIVLSDKLYIAETAGTKWKHARKRGRVEFQTRTQKGSR